MSEIPVIPYPSSGTEGRDLLSIHAGKLGKLYQATILVPRKIASECSGGYLL